MQYVGGCSLERNLFFMLSETNDAYLVGCLLKDVSKCLPNQMFLGKGTLYLSFPSHTGLSPKSKLLTEKKRQAVSLLCISPSYHPARIPVTQPVLFSDPWTSYNYFWMGIPRQ